MPRRTRDEGPTPEPPPAEAHGELADECLTPLPRARERNSTATAERWTQRIGLCSEAELLELMSMQHFEPEAARDAWEELYRRHSRYVAAVVSRALGERARDDDAVFDLVGDAFRTLFDWSARHRSEDLADRFEAYDPDMARRRVLGFLAVVARRMSARQFASTARGHREFLRADFDNAAAPQDEEADPPPAVEHSKLEDVLALLSSDEAEALRVSLPWYQVETGEFAFPRGEAARVAASLGITPEALRQRRSRSLRRLQSILRRP